MPHAICPTIELPRRWQDMPPPSTRIHAADPNLTIPNNATLPKSRPTQDGPDLTLPRIFAHAIGYAATLQTHQHSNHAARIHPIETCFPNPTPNIWLRQLIPGHSSAQTTPKTARCSRIKQNTEQQNDYGILKIIVYGKRTKYAVQYELHRQCQNALSSSITFTMYTHICILITLILCYYSAPSWSNIVESTKYTKHPMGCNFPWKYGTDL